MVAVCALLFPSASFGEEMPSPVMTALSSTSISGYVSTSGHWQRHVCRPVRPVRVHRLYKFSNGVIREFGYTVRCRHGDVYLPNGRIAELLPAPNRSSRFSPHTATPRIDDRTAVFLIEAFRIPRRPDGSFPPLPPLPPTPLWPTNWHPIVIQPPTNSVTRPPITDVPPVNGSSGLESNRLPPPNNRRTPPTMPPPPPTELTPTLQ